jgi:hypothetical protein
MCAEVMISCAGCQKKPGSRQMPGFFEARLPGFAMRERHCIVQAGRWLL